MSDDIRRYAYNIRQSTGTYVMSMQSTIEARIAGGIKTSHVEVINESYRHNVPTGSESHFKVTIVSDEFSGMTPVKRHQRIYQLLAEQLRGGVHALALHTYTPDEWRERNAAPASPPCLGGEKRK